MRTLRLFANRPHHRASSGCAGCCCSYEHISKATLLIAHLPRVDRPERCSRSRRQLRRILSVVRPLQAERRRRKWTEKQRPLQFRPAAKIWLHARIACKKQCQDMHRDAHPVSPDENPEKFLLAVSRSLHLKRETANLEMIEEQAGNTLAIKARLETDALHRPTRPSDNSTRRNKKRHQET